MGTATQFSTDNPQPDCGTEVTALWSRKTNKKLFPFEAICAVLSHKTPLQTTKPSGIAELTKNNKTPNELSLSRSGCMKVWSEREEIESLAYLQPVSLRRLIALERSLTQPRKPAPCFL